MLVEAWGGEKVGCAIMGWEDESYCGDERRGNMA